MRCLIAIVPFLTTGCLLSDDYEHVAPLSEFHLMTSVRDIATITFEHYGDNLDSPDCLILPGDVEATIGGSPLSVVTRGGYNGGGGCEFPKMELLDVPEATTSSIVIDDRTHHLSCNLGDALTRLTLTVPGPIAAGQSVTVTVTNLPGDTDILFAYLVTPTGTRQELGQSLSGNDVTITIPAHYRGDYELRVVATHKYSGPSSYTTPCGILFTAHHGRIPIVVTGS